MSDGMPIPRKGKKPITDLTGQTFGRLTVKSFAGYNGEKPAWNCECACGNPARVNGHCLRSGHTTSCGCLRVERLRDALSVIVPGQTYGRLTALRATRESLDGSVLWECQCACGALAKAQAKRLQNGNTGSCGCRKREAHQENIEGRMVDLAGRTFGLLTVERRASPRGKVQYWACLCACGGRKIVPHGSLTKGRTVACGCVKGGPKSDPLTPLEELQKAAARNHVRRARMKAAGGRFTAAQVDEIYRLQRGRCAYCRVKLQRKGIRRDHIVSLSQGGSNMARNIQITCHDCNAQKGAQDPLDFARSRGFLL